MSRTFRRPRARRRAGRRVVPVGLAALALVVTACGVTGGDSPAFAPIPETDDPGATADSNGQASNASAAAAPSDSDTDAPFVLRLDLDLDLEEPPTEEPETLDEKIEKSGYLEQAPEPDKAVLAQTGCAELAGIVVELQQELLDAVGDAKRSDIAAVDAAFERHGVNGTLVARHADQLGCEISEMTDVICSAKGQLTPRGEVGRDIVELAFGSC